MNFSKTIYLVFEIIQRLFFKKLTTSLKPVKTGKLFKLPKNIGPLVDIKIKKGGKTKISWRCLSALIEAKISLEHAKILLNEENLILNEDVLEDEEFIEGECFEI